MTTAECNLLADLMRLYIREFGAVAALAVVAIVLEDNVWAQPATAETNAQIVREAMEALK